jgi:hypothetical protein
MNHWPVATVNLKHRAPLSRRLFEYATDSAYKMSERCSLSLVQLITLSLSKHSLLQRMASNDNNDKCKLEEEAESTAVRKRLQLSDDDVGDDDSSDSLEEEEEDEEMEEEVSSEEKLQAKCHTRFLCQNQVLIVCMTQDQLFHTYSQKCSQITICHE